MGRFWSPIKRIGSSFIGSVSMKTIGQRWSVFFQVIIDPWVIALTGLGIFLGFILNSQDDPEVVTALLVIISLMAGVGGAITTSHWKKITEGGTIEARGQVAVRGLKLLLVNIVGLDRRVQVYLERQKSEKKRNSVVENYLEDVIGRCTILQEEALSAVENWTDIVPVANIRTQIGIITDLTELVRSKETEISDLKSESKEAEGKDKKTIDSLNNQIQEREKELTNTRRQLAAAENSGLSGFTINTGVIPPYTINTVGVPSFTIDSPILGMAGSPAGGLILSSTCSSCGEMIDIGIGPCPKCGGAR